MSDDRLRGSPYSIARMRLETAVMKSLVIQIMKY